MMTAACALLSTILTIAPPSIVQAPQNPPATEKPPAPEKPQQPPGAGPAVELLTPAPLDISTTDGSGALPFRLLITNHAAEIKAIDATVPVADGRAFQGTVTVEVGDSVPQQGNQRIQSATLVVKGASPVTPNAKFSGLLIIPGLGRVPYSITDKTNVVLAASPDKLAIRWVIAQASDMRVQLRNSGTSSFTLKTATVSLEDANTKRLILQDVSIPAEPVTIGPGQSREVTFTLPRPVFAGNYAGTLTIRSGTDSLALPLTMTTRGPSPNGLTWVPFVLFVGLVIIGIVLSSQLDKFFGDGGGMRRAETVIALATAESELERVEAALTNLTQSAGLDVAGVLAQFGPLRDAVRRARTVPNTPNVERVLVEARTGQLAGERLLRLLPPGIATLRGDPQAMAEVGKGLSRVPWPADDAALTVFDTAVRKVITDAHAAADSRAREAARLADAAPPTPTPVVLPPGTPRTAAAALRQIRVMTYFQNSVIWLVTVLTAYQTFFADNAAFGTFSHYVSVLMWALGITQAGTQILTRARRPANS